MADPIYWPHTYLKPAKIIRHLNARTIAGTVANSGFTQRIAPGTHSWNIQYGGIVIWTAEQLRWWDYVEGILDGGANPVYVPLLAEANGGDVNGTVTANQSAGSTSVTLTRTIAIIAGYHFDINGRLYRVVGSVSLGSNNYAVTIRPPLRLNIIAGDAVHFIVPFCRCKLATDEEMILDIDPARQGTGTVKFVEDPNP